jgi:predicted DNA-binding protein with PD1-like motif
MYTLIFLTITTVSLAQQTRIEFTYPPNPAQDSRPNSALIPDAYAIGAHMDSILVFRFKYQADLLAGMDSLVKHYKIRNAVILSGVGSVLSYHFHIVSNRTFPSKNIFEQDTSAPADIVSLNGYVIDGRIHAHVTFADADKAFGGHLELGTIIFTYAAVTIGVLKDGIDLKHVDDKTYR